ncbi:MAG: RHS repeat-associated core domain-containing protein [Chloroflexi bacterium]|nr:RHS repeat-associated core domain-containing protein [Chloroflexota bacterium]MBP7043336.1 RHS repeat-associated core domain-containing protein [Chloroflexota bacterium]
MRARGDRLAGGLGSGKRGVARRGRRPQQRAEDRAGAGGEEYSSYNVTPTGYRYTSQRWDSGLGLYDYNARYYDPALGKFISADTLVPEQKRLTPLTVAFHENQFLEKVNQENGQITQFGPISSWDAQQKKEFGVSDGPLAPQNLNRLAYSVNNPLRYLDPTGHYLVDHIDIDLTAQEVRDLMKELDWWINAISYPEDVATYLSITGLAIEGLIALGILASNPVTITSGAAITLTGALADWTNDDLKAIRLALEIASPGGIHGVHLTMGSDIYKWGIEINGVEAVSRLEGFPYNPFALKGTLNGTRSFMMGWYWFDY